MIRGSFRGFISGWPGVIMITIALLAIITCFFCWCASIFYGRSTKRRRNDDDTTEGESPYPTYNNTLKSTPIDPKEIHLDIGTQELRVIGEIDWVPPTDVPVDGICPYPTDPSHDGMPRPCV